MTLKWPKLGRLRNHLVLLSLFLVIGAMPALAETTGGLRTAMLVIVGGVISGVLANLSQKRLRWIALLLAVCPLCMALFGGLWTLLPLTVSAHIFFTTMNILLVFSVTTMTWMFMRSARADTDMLAAALSVYLLIGFLFACIFAQLLLILGPDAIRGLAAGPDGYISFPDTMYFSLVTLTTLGYGDVSPVAHVLRSLATLEAILGQTFLVVLVARLVGLQVADGQTTRRRLNGAEGPAT